MTIDVNNERTQEPGISAANKHPHSRSTKSPVFRAPQTETEKRVAQLLSQVLDVHPVGRHDDFFKLGGNSLLAVRFTVGVVKTFGVRIPPRRFYKGTTVVKIAESIDSLCAEQQLKEGE